WLGGVLVLAAGGVLLLPPPRFPLGGWGQGGRFHEGQPPSYWVYLLQDGADPDREKAGHPPGKLGAATPEVVPGLIAALKDKHYIVRRNAATALGELGPEAAPAVPALIEALRDKDHRVRPEVARALGGIGPAASKAVPALIEMQRR